MSSDESRLHAQAWPVSSLSIKIGGWFEARATGHGVIAVAIIVMIVLALGLIGIRLPF